MKLQERVVVVICILIVVVALGLYFADEWAEGKEKFVLESEQSEEISVSDNTQMDTLSESQTIKQETDTTQVETIKKDTSKEETKKQKTNKKTDSETVAAAVTNWKLVLVNRNHPGDLIDTSKLSEVEAGYYVDTRIRKALKNMLQDARKEGLDPMICSAFRSYGKQETLFNQKVQHFINQGYSEDEAHLQAQKIVAIPGTSEHGLGLAVDIISCSYQRLDKKQQETKEAKWLMKHCAEYGFILRYPVDKTKITGIIYEPWHYRYVGKKVAKEIMSKGICLEEYLGQD